MRGVWTLPWSVLTASILAAGIAASGVPAAAEEPDATLPPNAPGRRLDREILMELGRPEHEPGLEFSWTWFTEGNFRLKGKGLQYRHRFRAGERPVVMKLEGPKVDGGYGLVVQFDF